ncbi:MAG: UDP-N-acetylmuramoyl-tripeptide--D-alanyl-D-alanine ligase [Planctomycetota bacterium]
MIPTLLSDLHAACAVAWCAGDADPAGVRVRGVTTDSRGDAAGRLFVGVPGARFDGAAFAADAAAQGAVAILAQEGPGVRESLEQVAREHGVPVATCADAVAALAAMGAAVRARSTARVVGITGSCGKTSTKEILATLLGAARETVASRASFNNHIGVPLTLLEVEESTEALVVEIGTNHPGEIAPLAALARPHVAVVTNVGRSHLAGLGSLEGVAREKGALVEALSAGGTAILNLDCPRTPDLRSRARAGVRVLTFSVAGREGADVRAEDLRVGADGTRFVLQGGAVPAAVRGEVVHLPLLGEHAAANALAALAVVFALGAEPRSALDATGALRPAPHRLEPSSAGGVAVIDDAYNANPESVGAAARLLARMDGAAAAGANAPDAPTGGRATTRWLALGEMGELGDDSVALHREVGALVAALRLDRLVVVGAADEGGPLAALGAAAREGGVDVTQAASIEDAARVLSDPDQGLAPGDVLLVKASRAAGLEALADRVRASLDARTTHPLDRRGAEVLT